MTTIRQTLNPDLALFRHYAGGHLPYSGNIFNAYLFNHWLNHLLGGRAAKRGRRAEPAIFKWPNGLLYLPMQVVTDPKYAHAKPAFIEMFADHLKACSSTDGGVCIQYLLLVHPPSEKCKQQHMTILICRRMPLTDEWIIEHFDSNVSRYDNHKLSFDFDAAAAEFVAGIPGATYRSSFMTSAQINRSLNDQHGYCQLWSCLIIYLTAMHPEIATADIIAELCSHRRHIMTAIVRGFYHIMIQKVVEFLPAELICQFKPPARTHLPLYVERELIVTPSLTALLVSAAP